MELRPLQPAGEGSEATAAGQAHSGSPVRLSAQAFAWTNLLGTEFTDGQRCRGQGSWPQLLPSYRAEHGRMLEGAACPWHRNTQGWSGAGGNSLSGPFWSGTGLALVTSGRHT